MLTHPLSRLGYECGNLDWDLKLSVQITIPKVVFI